MSAFEKKRTAQKFGTALCMKNGVTSQWSMPLQDAAVAKDLVGVVDASQQHAIVINAPFDQCMHARYPAV